MEVAAVGTGYAGCAAEEGPLRFTKAGHFTELLALVKTDALAEDQMRVRKE